MLFCKKGLSLCYNETTKMCLAQGKKEEKGKYEYNKYKKENE